MFGRNGDDPSVFRDMADYLEMPTMMRYLWLHTGTGDRVTEYIQGLVGNAAASQTRTAAHLQRRAQGEQLDGDTSAGGVEQQ